LKSTAGKAFQALGQVDSRVVGATVMRYPVSPETARARQQPVPVILTLRTGLTLRRHPLLWASGELGEGGYDEKTLEFRILAIEKDPGLLEAKGLERDRW
jgi:hypothetical protein